MEVATSANRHLTLIEFVLFGLAALVCIAPRDSMAAPSSPGQLAKSAAESQQAAELGQMLLERLAEQRREAQADETAEPLRSVVVAKKANQKAGYDSDWQQKKQLKAALKKKWHKIVDELIDDQFAGSPGASELSQPIQRLREPQKRNPNGDLFADRQPSLQDLSSGQPAGAQSVDQQQQQQQQQAFFAREPSKQHLRNIMEDNFGILKESKFTTNNHLGLKGAPKFGSDESF